MKKRILFVDDEENILTALRRSLRHHRTEWEMDFSSNGRQALELADQQPFDVVVTDIRMPNINGIELLKGLQNRHPATTRIALSGCVDTDTIMNTAGLVHRYLAKPCNSATLEAVLINVLSLRELIDNDRIQALVGGLRSLPTLPAVYHELTEKLSAKSTTVRELSGIIAKDPPLAAKLLQLVNSVFYGLNRSISDPAEALTLLGVETLRGLVLTIGIFSQLDSKTFAAGWNSVQELVNHSIEMAAFGKNVAASEGSGETMIEETFIAALLHDIGMLLLIENFPREYAGIDSQARGDETRRIALEKEAFGADHGAVGGYLLGLWGLADPVVEAVSHHHQPTAAKSSHFSPLTVVHVAEALTGANTASQHADPWEMVNLDYLRALGLEHRLEAWWQLLHPETNNADDHD